MAIGRNPHVSRAQASEQKAADAPDAIARVRALRERSPGLLPGAKLACSLQAVLALAIRLVGA